ncbi:hypothetical protein BCR41DRAFT_346126 [Lobosporangium transversale]|uniref:Pacifastin domain-containing protein n=1 Tax=Lobosporangium transversale TaxID=64571 RepID=A0A1Y2H2C6_9FUNG|nr:hypothetical protein BCR41DRAFT_346126 [Lobosporangium transversale]ORZ27863.1 hypothetical protein BCR41DRAFT_346126 [Lobosporangium transversale]|eukprot:XP_021885566.1 hypothetical protein BCR41DRAFT_346126 [Lobosporangium transversale]
MKPVIILCALLVASLTAAKPNYSYKRCIRAYGPSSFVCDDLCNICKCARYGLISTEKACPPYDFETCKKVKGTGKWPCYSGNNICRCAPEGIEVCGL